MDVTFPNCVKHQRQETSQVSGCVSGYRRHRAFRRKVNWNANLGYVNICQWRYLKADNGFVLYLMVLDRDEHVVVMIGYVINWLFVLITINIFYIFSAWKIKTVLLHLLYLNRDSSTSLISQQQQSVMIYMYIYILF